MWHLEYDHSVPPLPALVKPRGKRGGLHATTKFLREGCWLLWLDPRFDDELELLSRKGYLGWFAYYQGTFRVEHKKNGLVASGDLYLKRESWHKDKKESEEAKKGPPLPQRPDKTPIFPRHEYRFYVQLTGLQAVGKGGRRFQASFATWRFNRKAGAWAEYGTLTAALRRKRGARLGWGKGEYLGGRVVNERGKRVARIRLGWIGTSLRRATIEMDKARGVDLPTDNGKGVGFPEAFATAKWEIECPSCPETVPGPADGVWNDRLLHEKMLQWRDGGDLDNKWRYHLFSVPYFAPPDRFKLGRMYDNQSVDSNLIPREGVVVAAHARFPDESIYGGAAGKRLQDVRPAFFRTAVHELGHAMGLLHNYTSRGFMQSTALLAEDAQGRFPDNIDWRFHPEDEMLLKHLPDLWVRPGGVPYGHRVRPIPVADEDVTSEGRQFFHFEVKSQHQLLPLGAPLRLYVRLKNRSKETLPGPESLQMKEGILSGQIVGPGGARTFATAKRLAGSWWKDLEPGQQLEYALTLIRGVEGPLLPTPGRYRVVVEAVWRVREGLVRTAAETSVMVGTPSGEESTTAALHVLECAEISVPLIFRSRPESQRGATRDALAAGVSAFHRAVADPSLAPHYTGLEAIRLADQGWRGVEKALPHLTAATVLSSAEVKKLLGYFEAAAKEKPERLGDADVRRAVHVLRSAALGLEAAGLADALASKRLSERAGDLLTCKPKPRTPKPDPE